MLERNHAATPLPLIDRFFGTLLGIRDGPLEELARAERLSHQVPDDARDPTRDGAAEDQQAVSRSTSHCIPLADASRSVAPRDPDEIALHLQWCPSTPPEQPGGCCRPIQCRPSLRVARAA
jgi:hypothetical protein